MHRAIVAGGLAALLTLALPSPVHAQQESGPNAAERRMALFDQAWGPESPETLEKYVAVRRAIKPRVEQYAANLTQYALREASTQSLLGPVLISVTLTRKSLEEALTEQGLDFVDYQRLNILVYGRWMRATSEEAPPEARVVRKLQEMAIGLERQLEHREFEEDQRAAVEQRLASIRHQARFLAPYAFMDKARVLAGLDPETKAWLEEHRAELEELDFGIFDTLVPERPRNEGA